MDEIDTIIDDVMIGLDPAAAATTSTEYRVPSTEETAPSASSAPPESATQESTESEPDDVAAADADQAEEDAPDYAAQLTEAQARLERLEQAKTESDRRAAELESAQEQAKRRANEQLWALAVNRVQQKLANPHDLEPHEHQAALAEYSRLMAVPGNERATQAEQEAERLSLYVTAKHLIETYGLDEPQQERMMALARHGPEAMEGYATTVHEARQAKDADIGQLRQQITELQLQVAARDRRDSGADTAYTGGGQVTQRANLDEIADPDEWFDAMYESSGMSSWMPATASVPAR